MNGDKRKESISYDPCVSGLDNWVVSVTEKENGGGTRSKKQEEKNTFHSRHTDCEAPQAVQVKICIIKNTDLELRRETWLELNRQGNHLQEGGSEVTRVKEIIL